MAARTEVRSIRLFRRGLGVARALVLTGVPLAATISEVHVATQSAGRMLVSMLSRGDPTTSDWPGRTPLPAPRPAEDWSRVDLSSRAAPANIAPESWPAIVLRHKPAIAAADSR